MKLSKLELVIGSILIIWGLLSIINALVIINKPLDFLWLCYFGLFLSGIGIVLKRDILVQSQIFILFIPDLLWTADFIKFALTGSSFLGISDYFFSDLHILTKLVSTQHLAFVPFSLWLLLRQKKILGKAYYFAIIQTITIFVLSRIFTNHKDNINCAYYFCGSLTFSEPYILWWIFINILLISIAYGLFYIIFKIRKN